MFEFTAILAVLCSAAVIAQDCKPVHFGYDSIVCECNSTYCDSYPDPISPGKGAFVWYATSRSGQRLKRTDGKIQSKPNNDGYTVRIDSNKLYQNIEGFGGAFTDSAGINIKSLSPKTQENLLNSYFSTNGSNYNFGRVPIGGTDFSTKGYTYDSTPGDKNLKDFSLAKEDTEYKIPLMKKALKINPSLRFFSAAWTPPLWMKNVQSYYGFSHLLEEYYQTYADYIVKFLQEYQKYGLEMWAVSTGNEPFTSLGDSKISSMFWSPGNVSKWVMNNLGPSIEKSTSNNTIILMFDDQRLYLPWYMIEVKAKHSEALKYVKGIGVHWYRDDTVPVGVLDITHDLFPDKFILMTEACIGDRPYEQPKVVLGSWKRAEILVNRIFENINHHVVGWVDWNMALDLQGGPTWIGNYVDSPIIVDAKKDVFYKQPMYYVITHFSKFVPRNSVRIYSNSEDTDVITTAFKTKDNRIIVLLFNKSDQNKSVSVIDDKFGNINVELPEHSVHTILYKYNV